MKFLVMQTTETGEVFCVQEFDACCDAEFWIDENEEGFPESKFRIEAQADPFSPWIICPRCEGEGKNSRHLGSINREEWDEDEFEDYMAGAYDRPCSCCKGSGKIRADDYDQFVEQDRMNHEDYRVQCAEDGRADDFWQFN